MYFNFFKYNSIGNDFIIVDETIKSFNFTKNQIKKMCSRQFYIGADGLVLLKNSKIADFKMVIYNSDGVEADMCGNALLCLVKFIYDNINKKNFFLIETKSFIYETFVQNKNISFKSEFPKIVSENNQITLNNLKLSFPIIDSGVLHGVIFFNNIDDLDVYNLGREIRYSTLPAINVNFCEKINDAKIKVRTYEKGVENETFSCSTGALAVAYEIFRKKNINKSLTLIFRGGKITVNDDNNSLKLIKTPKFAFKGLIKIFD